MLVPLRRRKLLICELAGMIFALSGLGFTVSSVSCVIIYIIIFYTEPLEEIPKTRLD